MADSSEDLKEVFARKYDDLDSDWGGGSGPGSDPYYNLPYRSFLENFIVHNRIGSVVEIGCGDWQFSKFIRFDNSQYLGLDIVEKVIARNNARFAAPNISFKIMPEDKSLVPNADLLVIKDVLQHLNNNEIGEFYSEVIPKYRYCLITNSHHKLNTPRNIDVASGGFRCLDLTDGPFFWKGAYVLRFNTGVWEEIRTLLITN